MKKSLALLLVLALDGCAVSRSPQVDQRFGQAVNSAKARQTIDPQAGAKAPDPHGIDGNAAAESIQRYRDSFKAPPPTFVIINGAPSGSAR